MGPWTGWKGIFMSGFQDRVEGGKTRVGVRGLLVRKEEETLVEITSI